MNYFVEFILEWQNLNDGCSLTTDFSNLETTIIKIQNYDPDAANLKTKVIIEGK